MRVFPVAIVGAGGAGLMAAWWSARGKARPVVLEGSEACGRKILISGGGRCNLLPVRSEGGDFFTSGSRNVLRRVFRTWPLDEVRAFFEQEFSVPLEEEPGTGKLFPAGRKARPVRDRMVARVTGAGAEILTGWKLTRMEARQEGGYLLISSRGDELAARRVVLATGGCSVPSTGSDGSGLLLAQELGHTLIEPYPALVPLTTRDRELQSLAGIALPVRWRALAGGRVREERERELLFTHQGFSGPAVLDASHWAVRDGCEIQVAWAGGTPDQWEQHWRSRGRRECGRALADFLPRRLADLLLGRAGLRPATRIGNLNRPDRDRLLARLCAFPLPVSGDAGFAVAEVTGGGVPLGEVNPSTLESRAAPGVFLCGEMLDVIGRIGGYNFLWAWVTGRLAGECAARA